MLCRRIKVHCRQLGANQNVPLSAFSNEQFLLLLVSYKANLRMSRLLGLGPAQTLFVDRRGIDCSLLFLSLRSVSPASLTLCNSVSVNRAFGLFSLGDTLEQVASRCRSVPCLVVAPSCYHLTVGAMDLAVSTKSNTICDNSSERQATTRSTAAGSSSRLRYDR